MEPLLLLLSGAVFFPSLYCLINRTLRNLFRDRLTPADVPTISEKCVSSIQAILSSITGAVIVSSCTDIMQDSHWLTNTYAYFGMPYFYYDVWAMYRSHQCNYQGSPPSNAYSRLKQFVAKEKIMMVHHIVIPHIFLPVIVFVRQGRGDFFVGVFYMIELTVPFISAREIMVQLKLKSSPWYLVVGLLMIAVFTVTRILVFPFLYVSYAHFMGMPVWQVPGAIPLKCNLGCLLLLLPQLYWWFLMVRGAYRVFYRIYTGSARPASADRHSLASRNSSLNHGSNMASHRVCLLSKQS